MISIQRSWTERVFGTLGKIPNTGTRGLTHRRSSSEAPGPAEIGPRFSQDGDWVTLSSGSPVLIDNGST